MRRILFLAGMIALSFVCSLEITPAYAQATRTWVSGVGDDVNPCSRTAPCKTFAGAISKTALNGEINCLDPAGYGAVTITKSMTIDCKYTLGSILNAGTNGINIPYDSFGATDTRKTVRLRGLSFQGADTGLIGVRITGAANSAGSAVFIEDTVIDGNFGGSARGISDERSGGGELYVTNTTIRNTGSFGIFINPLAGASGGSRIDATLESIRIQNSNFGLLVGSAARVMLNNSVVSGNSSTGIVAEGPFSAVELNVNNSVATGNNVGVATGSGTVTIRLSNNNISYNAQGISGTTQSFGNNRISGNTSAGTAPTPIGADAAAKGQQ